MNFYTPAIRIIFLFAYIITFHSCKQSKNIDDLKDVKVNPEFEMNPPIAEDVWLKKIKGDDNKLLIVARFSQGQLKEKFLAFNYDTAKLVMRDDGKAGDEKEADGLYSVIFSTNVKEFEKTASAFDKEAGKRFIFRGRSIISDTSRPRFEMEKFNKGDLISIRHLLPGPPPPLLKDHSLMITDLNVIEDPARTFNFCTQTGNINGAWTFKTLMKELAKTSPTAVVTDDQLADFTLHFFHEWIGSHTVNGESIGSRSEMSNFIESWVGRSQVLTPPRVPPGHLDMRAVPVKLMAIVNRMDLRGNSGYGSSNAGEGRLVFSLMSANGCNAMRFTIIFEYGVPKKTCEEQKAYARQWYELKDIAFTDPQFNTRLQAITDQFTLSGTNPKKANQSSINQVRSDEFAMGAFPWELREFHLDRTTHLLESAPVKQTAAVKYNAKINNADVQRLASYINTNEATILANTYIVPPDFSGNTFLGAHSFNGKPPVTRPVGMPEGELPNHWNATTTAGPAFINSDNARQIFSLNTCSGCHGGETQTSFTMIDPVPYGTQATLSGFLTGTPGIPFSAIVPVDLDGDNGIMNVPDPAGRASSNDLRKFNDLERRANDLQEFVVFPCISVFHVRDILMKRPMNFVH